MKILNSLSVLALLAFSGTASAALINCPPPSAVNCIPAVNSLLGWTANGGQMTGNSFSPNSQCANLIRLGGGLQRLVCCYSKCGVFLRDIRANRCQKINVGSFVCE